MKCTALLLSFVTLASAATLQKRWNPAGYDTSTTVNTPGAKCSRQSYSISVNPEISVFSNVDSNSNETVLTATLLEFVASLPTLR